MELGKHKRDHPYRVVDNTHYPVFAPDWTATEELLMLSGTRVCLCIRVYVVIWEGCTDMGA